MTMKTPRGVAGNAKSHTGIVDRQWASASYDPTTGRASSSLSPDQSGRSPVGAKVGAGVRQMTDAFTGIDKTRTQGRTPVRDRPFTQKHEG